MTIEQLLKIATEDLHAISATPRLDAEVLLAFVLKESREYLFSHPEEKVISKTKNTFQKLVLKRARKMPVAYLTRKQEFYGLDFYINKDVLIPRPETEELVEDVLEICKHDHEPRLILDVGTGSGCIACAIAKLCHGTTVLGFEISEPALAIARKNVKLLNLEKEVRLYKSNLLAKLPGKLYQIPKIIVANLPYIGTVKNNFVSDEVKKYEPKVALFGGKDGLELYEKLLEQIVKKKISFNWMFFEIGFSQVESIEKLIKKYLPKARFRILKDLAGFPRTVRIQN